MSEDRNRDPRPAVAIEDILDQYGAHLAERHPRDVEAGLAWLHAALEADPPVGRVTDDQREVSPPHTAAAAARRREVSPEPRVPRRPWRGSRPSDTRPARRRERRPISRWGVVTTGKSVLAAAVPVVLVGVVGGLIGWGAVALIRTVVDPDAPLPDMPITSIVVAASFALPPLIRRILPLVMGRTGRPAAKHFSSIVPALRGDRSGGEIRIGRDDRPRDPDSGDPFEGPPKR